MWHVFLLTLASGTAPFLLKYLIYYSSFLKLNLLLVITDQKRFSMVFN